MSIQFADEPLQKLIDSLCKLPGVGQRTARRMAYHLLQYDRESAQALSESISNALTSLQHCSRCNSFTIEEICETCRNPRRDHTQLCIVENPIDQNMIESSHSYKGLYYVLMGKLQPLDGVGAKQLNLKRLIKRVLDDTQVREVILATNYTTEGQTTAHYLTELLESKGIKVSRIARGVPAGSELEYVDAGTIAWALMDRK